MTLDDANDTDGRRTVPAGTLVVAVAALLVTVAPAVAGAAGAVSSQAATTPSFVVDLAADGSARVTLTLTYDLETDDERAAFRTLQNDPDTRTDTRDRFASRMSSVAADAGEATGREMSVGDPAIELSTTDGGSVGVVELSVTWTEIAARTDGMLVVTEPFASGFQPDQRFTVRGPEGYELATTEPSPDDTTARNAIWSAGTDLTGFRVAFEQAGSDGGSPETASGDGAIGAPGFGPAVALLALAVALAVVRRRVR